MSERGASGGIGSRSITAVLWGTGATIVRIGVQVVSQIVLVQIKIGFDFGEVGRGRKLESAGPEAHEKRQ